MKKRWTLLIFPLLVALMLPAASARELPGNVLSFVLNSPDDAVLADDCRADAEDARIIIASGAHYQLIAAAKQENGWESAVVSTTAVYQPSDGCGLPTLARTEEGFELAYPDAGEVYRFELWYSEGSQPIYTLVYAKMGDVEVTQQGNACYVVTQDGESVLWRKHITLDNFAVRHMPHRGTADVRRMNEMTAGLQDAALFSLPVSADADRLVRVPIRAAFDTCLTDDPFTSETQQTALPAGTPLTALGYPARNWAYLYAEAEVDGQTVRGFVPMRDVAFDDVELPEEAEKVVGSWQLYSGSSICEAYLRLDADGRFYASNADGVQPYSGTWRVVQNNPNSGVYPEPVPAVLVLSYADGHFARVGVSYALDDDANVDVTIPTLTLLDGEGGCGYAPYGALDESGNWLVSEDGEVCRKTLPTAPAEDETLPDALTSLVTDSPDYAAYGVLVDDYREDASDVRIIIGSEEHYQLIAAAKYDDGWKSVIVSTTAVYQPSDGCGLPTLARTEEGFELAYPDAGEIYRFALSHDSTNQPMYTLVYAKMGDMEVAKRENFGYLVTQGEDSAVWSKTVTLADFNIHQMPRGTADVRRMNEMACGLQRFANERKDGVKEIRQEWRHVPIQTVCGTYLMDDPHVSEAHQAELPAGTKLTALGYCGWAYVYVEAEVDGETLYGFVPQRDVIFDDVEQPELMAEFVGHWRAKGGGGWYDDFQLDADGHFSAADDDGERTCSGTWSIVQTPAGSNLYWRGDIPTIVLRGTDGTVSRYGIQVEKEKIMPGAWSIYLSLSTNETGRSYVPDGADGDWVYTDDIIGWFARLFFSILGY